MMDSVQLCELARNACCKILVLRDNKRVSFGTGVLIHPQGHLLTALHVISDRKQWLGDTIGVQVPGSAQWFTYQPVLEHDLSINTDATESKPFPLDMALLKPSAPMPIALTSVTLRREIAPIGTEVMMAGFSDDIYWPFNFEDSFDKRKFEGIDKEKEFKEQEPHLRQLLCKRAMVGSPWTIKLNNWGSPAGTETAAYTLDNDISYGASGGPVLDYDGRLVGIIAKRGVGGAEKFGIPAASGGLLTKLPTATAHALGHSIVTALLPPELRT